MEINIKNGVKRKCPFCNAIYAIENDTEILYRGISLVYLDKAKNCQVVKCKQCKNIVELKS